MVRVSGTEDEREGTRSAKRESLATGEGGLHGLGKRGRKRSVEREKERELGLRRKEGRKEVVVRVFF